LDPRIIRVRIGKALSEFREEPQKSPGEVNSSVESPAVSDLSSVDVSNGTSTGYEVLPHTPTIAEKTQLDAAGLVALARKKEVFNSLPERQKTTLDYLYLQEGAPLCLKEVGKRMGGITIESVRKLKKKGLRKLKNILNVQLPLVVNKTQAMRQIEAEYGVPIDQVLKDLASEGLSKTEIGKRLHASRRTIKDWFDKLDIGEVEVKKFRRTSLMLEVEQRFKKPAEQILRKKYTDQKKGLVAIAQELAVDENTVRRWLDSFGISARTHQEAMEIALLDPKKREKITRKTKETRRKLSISLRRHHAKRREEADREISLSV